MARTGECDSPFKQLRSHTVKQLIKLLVEQKLIQIDCSSTRQISDGAAAETSRSFSVLLTDRKGIIVFVLAESEE